MRAALIASSLVSVLACSSSSSPPPQQATRNVAPAPALADPLALLPADSDLVMRIDVASLRKSPLWQTYRRHVFDLLTPGFADCGYDPLDTIETVTAGIPMNAALGVFVVRGIDKTKTLHCLRTSKIETKTTPTFDGDFVLLTNKSGNANLVTFLDATTMVMQGSKGPTKQTLERALQVGAPLREDRDYVAAEAKLRQGSAFAMLARPGSQHFARGMEARLGAPARGFAATVHVTDVISAHAVVTLADEETARRIVDDVRPQLDQLRELVERYDIRTDGPNVVVDLTVTEAQIQTFVMMGKAMMGGAE